MSEVRVLADAEALAKEASKAIAERIRAAEGQRFTLAVSGGSTPKRMFQHLARETLNWSKVHLFWVDERCVPPDHAESNYRMTAENLLSDVNLPAGQIHRMRGELLPAAGAEVYETELKSFFGADALPRFDLILLGMGDDGHTASIFPDSPLLDEKDRWAAVGHSPAGVRERITLTLPVINRAREVMFLISGEKKAAPLEKVLDGGERTRQIPAQWIAPEDGTLSFWVDQAAMGETARNTI